AIRTPSGCRIRVATPTCLPSLSLSVASADSGAAGSFSAVIPAHPANATAMPTTSSRLTVESPPGSCRLCDLRDERLGRLAEPLHVVELDVLVAADHVRQVRQGHRRVVAGGGE